MLKRKVTKLLRYVRWVIPSSNAIPVHWHVGRPNFGDDINPELFKNLLGRQVMLSRDVNHERILGMGSILGRADKNCHVVGSGLLDPKEEVVGGVKSVVALRGELSARATGFSPEFLGDPAIFLPKYFRFSLAKHYQYGFLPHHSEADAVRSSLPNDWLFIDPAWEPKKVLRSICLCEKIVSRSLHGLICADAYGVPNVWLHPLEEMRGATFKYRDYYTTVDTAKQSTKVEVKDLCREAGKLDYFVSHYRYECAPYLNHVLDLVPILRP